MFVLFFMSADLYSDNHIIGLGFKKLPQIDS